MLTIRPDDFTAVDFSALGTDVEGARKYVLNPFSAGQKIQVVYRLGKWQMAAGQLIWSHSVMPNYISSGSTTPLNLTTDLAAKLGTIPQWIKDGFDTNIRFDYDSDLCVSLAEPISSNLKTAGFSGCFVDAVGKPQASLGGSSFTGYYIRTWRYRLVTVAPSVTSIVTQA